MTEVGPIDGWNWLLGNPLPLVCCFLRLLYCLAGLFICAAWPFPRRIPGVFRGEPSDLRSVGSILRDALALRGRGIIQLGLLVLIATPVARVGFSIFGFAEEHDRMYVVVGSIVLLVLAYSLIGFPWSP